MNVSSGLPLKDALQQGPFLNNLKSSYLCNGVQGAESLRNSFHNDIYDPFLMATDASQDSDTGRKILDKFKMIQSNSGDDNSHAFDRDQTHDACGKALLSNHFTEISSEDLPAGQKVLFTPSLKAQLIPTFHCTVLLCSYFLLVSVCWGNCFIHSSSCEPRD